MLPNTCMPSSAGSGGTFSLGVYDSAGFSQIDCAYLRFGSHINQNDAYQCIVSMDPSSTTTAQLQESSYDNTKPYYGSDANIPYSSGPTTINTPECTLSVQTTTMTGVTSTNMTANFATTLLTPLSGTRNIYADFVQGVSIRKSGSSGWHVPSRGRSLGKLRQSGIW